MKNDSFIFCTEYVFVNSLFFFSPQTLASFHYLKESEQKQTREREHRCKKEGAVMRIGCAHYENHGNPSVLP